MVDDRTGEIHDFRAKGGVESKFIVLPGGGTMARSDLWNKVEKSHKRADAVTAREIEIAIPCELSKTERTQLIARYCTQLADKYGVAVDGAVHKPSGDKRNIHAHILMSACYVSATGEMGKKCVELDPIHCNRAKINNAVETQRVIWQDMCNQALQQAGRRARIDHRTLEAQGITDRPAGVHLGPAVSEIVKDDRESDVADRIAAEVKAFMGQVQAAAAIAAAQESAEMELADADAALAEAQRTLETVCRQPAPVVPVQVVALPTLAEASAALHDAEQAAMGTRRTMYEFSDQVGSMTSKKAAIDAAKAKALKLEKAVITAKDRVLAAEVALAAVPQWQPLKRRSLEKVLAAAKIGYMAAIKAEKHNNKSARVQFDQVQFDKLAADYNAATKRHQTAEQAEQMARQALKDALPRAEAERAERDRQGRNVTPKMAESQRRRDVERGG